MFGINLKHSLATVAVAVAVLAAAGSASAGTPAYQHNQPDLEFPAASVTDGSSNTIMFGERAAAGKIAADGRGADLIVLMADNGGQF